MAMKQKDAVFAAFNAGQQQGLEGEALKSFAAEQIKQGLMSGEVSHKEGPVTDEAKATKYAKSLISNWTKKDERLTNGVKYVPATRRGPQVKDETLKKLNESLKSLKVHSPDNMTLITSVQAKIDERKAQLAAEKAGSKVQTLEEAMATLAELGVPVEG